MRRDFNLVSEAELTEFDDILEDIGLGNRVAYSVARRLAPNADAEPAKLSQTSEARPLAIKGSEGLLTSYAKCCRPIPGDPIVGHISKGRGMVIHHETCNNVSEIRDNPEKCVFLTWDDDLNGEFYTALKILVEAEPVLSPISLPLCQRQTRLSTALIVKSVMRKLV